MVFNFSAYKISSFVIKKHFLTCNINSTRYGIIKNNLLLTNNLIKWKQVHKSKDYSAKNESIGQILEAVDSDGVKTFAPSVLSATFNRAAKVALSAKAAAKARSSLAAPVRSASKAARVSVRASISGSSVFLDNVPLLTSDKWSWSSAIVALSLLISAANMKNNKSA